MLFSSKTEEGKYLENYFSNRPKKERGKIDKIHKHFQYSLNQLKKIDDRHTLDICIRAVYENHVNWAKHCIHDKVVKDKFFKILIKEKINFLKLKNMSNN